jgi:hypothetical protein
MSVKGKRKLVKVTIRLYEGQAEFLDEVYPTSGYNKVIRALISKHQQHVEAAGNKASTNLKNITVDIGDLT